MRGWIRLKLERPLSSSTAISPSRMACEALTWRGRTLNSGYCCSQRFPVRERMESWASSMKHSARTPSHFTSYSQESPEGGRVARVASMGEMVRGIGAFTAPFGKARGSGLGRWKVLVYFLLRSAGEDTARVILDIPAGLGIGVFLLDQQPFVAFAASA